MKKNNLHKVKSVLQVGDNDLVGNKFNGHEAHKAMVRMGYNSSHLVWNKESDNNKTFVISGNKPDRKAIRCFTEYVQNLYDLDNIHNPIIYEIIYNQLFLDADVVHLHLMHNGLWDLNLLPMMSKLKPIIWSVHDMWIATGSKDAVNRKDYYFPLSNVKNTYMNWYLKRESISQSNITFVVASRYMERNLKEHTFFKNKDIVYLPYGLDTKVFFKQDKNQVRGELGIGPHEKVIIFRGDGGKKKGLHYIEHVINKLGTKYDIHFLILGGNEIDVPQGVRSTWYGWVKDDKLLSKIYSAGDLFLMPSTRESFGMMAIEAMACGTLPIVIDGTSLPETVNHPTCGIATRQNKNEYTATVEKYILDAGKRDGRQKLCIDFVYKKHNLSKHVNNLLKVYQKKLDEFIINQDADELLQSIKTMNSIVPSKKEKKSNFFYNKASNTGKAKFIEMFLEDNIIRENRKIQNQISELLVENQNLRDELSNVYSSKRWVYSSILANLKLKNKL